MAVSGKEALATDWTTRIDDLAVDDETLRVFARLLHTYLALGVEDQEGIATMAAIAVDPESDDDDAQAALNTLRESLSSSAKWVDLSSETDLNDAEWQTAREMDVEEATFAERLKACMAARSMSQVQLARASDVGQPAISMMLARNCRPQRRTIEKLSRALGVAPDELWVASRGKNVPPSASESGKGGGSSPEIDLWTNDTPLASFEYKPHFAKTNDYSITSNVGHFGPDGPKAAA